MPRVRFITLGCRLNQAEEAIFAADFSANGWDVAFGGDDADADGQEVVVLHSCAVTRMAERKTLQAIRALKRVDPPKAAPMVAVTGCATAALPEQVLREAGADLIIPRTQYASLRAAVEAAVGFAPAGASSSTGFAPGAPAPGRASLREMPLLRPGRHHAMLKVQDGCDFRCAYCIVPYTRGPATSRPFAECVAEATAMAKAGVPEIVMTGCNLACYRDGAAGLPELAAAVCEAVAPMGATVSLGSVEPAICDEAIVTLMLAHKNLKRFVHLPIQSGDSKVLALARRRYNGERIREILALYRREVPNLFLGADFITGLPGEDEEAFLRTCDLVKDFSFDHIHVFPYSPRQGTAALALPDIPSRAVARARAARLRALTA